MKILYLKVGSTGLGYDVESTLPDEVLHVCYRMEETDGNKTNVLASGEDFYRPEFRREWTDASLRNGIWPEMVEDCPYFRKGRMKYHKMMQDADVVVMDNLRFNRMILMQSGFIFPEGKKFVDVVTEYDKAHPEILKRTDEVRDRSSMDDITEALSYLKHPETAEEKLNAIADVYHRLDANAMTLQSVDEFTKDGAKKDTYFFCEMASRTRLKAEKIADVLVKEDNLFDKDLEAQKIRNVLQSSSMKNFVASEDKIKETLRREIIRQQIRRDTMTTDMVRNALKSIKIKFLGNESRNTAGRDDIIVTYEIDGRVFRQKYAKEHLDGMAQAYLGKKNRQWFKFEDAEKNTEKGLFSKLSNDEQNLLLEGVLTKGGKLSFLPKIEKCSDTLKEFYKLSCSNGNDLEIQKDELEMRLGKSWNEIYFDLLSDFNNMGKNQGTDCLNVPLQNLILYRRGKDDETVIVSAELSCAFSSSEEFYEKRKDRKLNGQEYHYFDNFAFYGFIYQSSTPVEDVFDVKNLCSGSSGNATLVKTKDESFMIDAGGGVKKISEALKNEGLSYKGLDMLFITHEHSDHIQHSMSLLKDGPYVFATTGTWQGIVKSNGTKGITPEKCFVMPDVLQTKSGLEIRKLDASHDVNSPCMYQFIKEGKSLVYVTDTGMVTDTIRKAVEKSDHLIIEANHEERLLKVDPNHNDFLQCRIHSNQGHLSNQQTEDLLVSLNNPPKKIWLAHISETSNTEEHIRAMIHRAMKRNPVLEYSEFKILHQDEVMQFTPKNRKPVPVIPVEYHVKTNDMKRN